MGKSSRILVCGLDRMLNNAFMRYFKRGNFINAADLTGIPLDLLSQKHISGYFKDYKPDIVIYTGSISGGISANIEYPAEFMYKNIIHQTNVMNSAKEANVDSLIFFASSCVYPKDSPQPIKEESLLSGPLEETNEPYAVAKIAGIKMCKAYNKQYGTNFIAIVPATIYGPEDDFDSEGAHVVSALMRKFDDAKSGGTASVEVWGSGLPRREFIFVDDLVDASISVLSNYKEKGHINVGCSQDYSIKELSSAISEIVGFKGQITYNTDKPDGVRQKLLDSTKITSLGWRPKVSLKEGISITYNWFKEHTKEISHLRKKVHQ